MQVSGVNDPTVAGVGLPTQSSGVQQNQAANVQQSIQQSKTTTSSSFMVISQEHVGMTLSDLISEMNALALAEMILEFLNKQQEESRQQEDPLFGLAMLALLAESGESRRAGLYASTHSEVKETSVVSTEQAVTAYTRKRSDAIDSQRTHIGCQQDRHIGLTQATSQSQS